MNLIRTILIFFFSVPVFGSKFFIPILLIIFSVSNIKYLNRKFYIYSIFLFSIILFSQLFLSTRFDPNMFYILIAIILSVNSVSIESKNLKIILFIMLFFHIFSIFTLFQFEIDFFPNLLYGESRHLVQSNTFVNFRPSGVFQEPSTFAVYYLVIAILLSKISKEKNRKYIIFSILLSLLTFSVISLLFPIVLIPFFKRIRYIFLLFIPIIFFIYEFINQFAFNKINAYFDMGIENYARFELLFEYLNDFNYYGFQNDLSAYVAYDLGPIVYLFIFAGIFSFPLIIFLLFKAFKNLNLLVLLLTKISISNPLFWIAMNNRQR